MKIQFMTAFIHWKNLCKSIWQALCIFIFLYSRQLLNIKYFLAAKHGGANVTQSDVDIVLNGNAIKESGDQLDYGLTSKLRVDSGSGSDCYSPSSTQSWNKLEKKYKTLIISFQTDKYTLDRRLKSQVRI